MREPLDDHAVRNLPRVAAQVLDLDPAGERADRDPRSDLLQHDLQ